MTNAIDYWYQKYLQEKKRADNLQSAIEVAEDHAFLAGQEATRNQFRKIENYQEEGWYSSGDDEYVYGISFDEPVKLPVEFYIKKK